jgi:uncharacterized RDD family membrane protein YckC
VEAAIIFALASLLLMPIYFALSHARPSGQTLGKRMIGISVRDMRTGSPLDRGRAFGRAYFMFALCLAGGSGSWSTGCGPSRISESRRFTTRL